MKNKYLYYRMARDASRSAARGSDSSGCLWLVIIVVVVAAISWVGSCFVGDASSTGTQFIAGLIAIVVVIGGILLVAYANSGRPKISLEDDLEFDEHAEGPMIPHWERDDAPAHSGGTLQAEQSPETTSQQHAGAVNHSSTPYPVFDPNAVPASGELIRAPLVEQAPVQLTPGEKFAKSELTRVDRLTGHQFEHYLASLLQRLGYQAEVTVGSGDFGVDVVAVKDSVRVAIQAKHWRGKVNHKAVQEVAGAIHYYKCTHMAVMTNSTYSPSAKKLARTNACILIDRKGLLRMVANEDVLGNAVRRLLEQSERREIVAE